MGDPFTYVTGIAGLISLTLEVTKITRSYVRDFRKAKKDAEEMLLELQALNHVLIRLVEFLKHDMSRAHDFDRTSVIVLSCTACERKLKEIRTKLLSRSNRKIFKSIVWPFEKKEHQITVTILHQWVQTFQFALTIDGWYYASANENAMMADNYSQLLSQAAADVTSIMQIQLKTLDETQKISQAVPTLQRSTEEASLWMKAILETVRTLPPTTEDMLNIKENVETLTRLALDDRIQKSQKLEDQRSLKLLKWLSPLNLRAKQADILGRRSPSTGEWLITHAQFQKWVVSVEPSCLWCMGIPGAGKTVLTSIVIDYLQAQPPKPKTAVAFIYFDYKNKDTHNVTAVLWNLLRQLLEQLDTIPEDIRQHCEAPMAEGKQNDMDIDQCLSFLRSAQKSFDRTFMIFDALDECPVYDSDSNELRSEMLATMQKLSRTMNIFMTSRPNVNLPLEITKFVRLEVNASSEDLSAYLKTRVASHKILNRIVSHDPRMKDDIVTTICKKAKGMFLLAELHMDFLVHQTSARNVQRALVGLPEKLNDTFDDALGRTAAQPQAYALLANQVLSWIFYAKRPLSLAELREALSVEPGDTKLDRSGCPELDLLLDVCCGLVIVDEQDNVIRLVHYSFQQYLEDNWNADVPEANWGISLACLTYLMLDDFSPEATENASLTDVDGQDIRTALPTRSQWRNSHRFFSYVASYWCEHVRGELERKLETLILRVLDQRMHLLYSLQGYNKIRHRNIEYDTWPHEPSPLHLTSYWGLAHITRVLITRGNDANIKDARGRTPLLCAAINGHVDIIHELVSSGADITMRDAAAITPLHASVANNHLFATTILLQQGSDANAIDHEGTTPLCFAASNGNLTIMRLLLQKGALLELRKDHGLSPLELASRNGHSASIQWLLMKGVSTNAPNSFPLIEAVYANHAHIVRILLDAGADVNAVDRLGNTAMEVAVVQGNVSIIQGLVAAGAVVNDVGSNGEAESSLQLAAYKGDVSLVQQLVGEGANVHADGGDRGTVLQCALYSRNLAVVDLILQRLSCQEVSLSSGIFGTTPIQLAVLSKNKDLLSLVLDYRSMSNFHDTVDVNLPTPFSITPLHQAVYLGWKPGVDELLKAGANPEVRDLYGQTALDWSRADPDLFHALGGDYTGKKTMASVRHSILKCSITRILEGLLLNSDRKNGHRIDYHYLDHCLLLLGEIEDARTTFEQQIIDASSTKKPEHNVLCHLCNGSKNIVGKRFVCYTCADIDLCKTHMGKYRSKPPDLRCKGHKFLEIPGSDWRSFGTGEGKQKNGTIDQWLRRLHATYSITEF